MLWTMKKSDKKNTLVFRTKKGIKRSRLQNISSEQTDSECTEEQIQRHSESGMSSSEGERVNG